MELCKVKAGGKSVHYADGERTVCGLPRGAVADAAEPVCSNCRRVARMRAQRAEGPVAPVEVKPPGELERMTAEIERLREKVAERDRLIREAGERGRAHVAEIERLRASGEEMGKANALLRRKNTEQAEALGAVDKAGGVAGVMAELKAEREKSKRLAAALARAQADVVEARRGVVGGAR